MRPGIVLLPRKDVILMAVYVSVQSQYTPACQYTFTHMKVSYAVCTECTSYHDRCLHLHVADDSLDGPFLLNGTENSMSVFGLSNSALNRCIFLIASQRFKTVLSDKCFPTNFREPLFNILNRVARWFLTQ